MMFLTRITLGKSQAASLRISDAYVWHQRLWEAFPGKDGENRRFLFRIDDDGRDFRALMLSPSNPTAPTWGHWETKKVAESFFDHPSYRFQLRANPTMRRNADRRRLAIYGEDRLRDWMFRKADQHGFEVTKKNLVVGAPIDEFFIKKNKRGKHVSVDFTGILNVTDRETFVKAFQNGVGSAKAFGFGMLALSPLK